MKPLCIDLYCGLGGWAEGFLSEGYDVIGFDIERHDYGTGGYPGQLVLQDVTTLDGARFKDATVIVGSSPCQEFSYRAMPWKRAKALPPPYEGMRLFEAQFRIQREASVAAGRKIPLIVENVCGAQKWVKRARWHYGSYYLWGDVPALMPWAIRDFKVGGTNLSKVGFNVACVRKFAHGDPNVTMADGRKIPSGSGVRSEKGRSAALANYDELRAAIKCGGDWFNSDESSVMRRFSSRSTSRKAASAQIAKIPFPLAQWIASVYRP